jgi:hypothetical protein
MKPIDRKPHTGERIIYKHPDREQVYISMGTFGNHEGIINICTPEQYALDRGHNEHTQIIYKFTKEFNKFLYFE